LDNTLSRGHESTDARENYFASNRVEFEYHSSENRAQQNY